MPDQQETLVDMISVELEASMQSSVMSELQAAATSVGEGPPTSIPDSPVRNGGVHTNIPDSSAIVGQVFQLKVPPGPDHASCNFQVSKPKYEHIAKPEIDEMNNSSIWLRWFTG